jgi:sugar (pentulose or hexulose) kinase
MIANDYLLSSCDTMERAKVRGTTIIIDIGKTLSKVSLWTNDGVMVDKQTRANEPCVVDGLKRLDVGGIAAWLSATLPLFAKHPITAIIPVGHGAGVVAMGGGDAVFPPLDYEQDLPNDIMTDYRAQRDDFALTGSPALPAGLNMGAQIFWMDRLYPQEMAGATLLPWAQYWAFWLSGAARSEVSSLGCHSDLWAPAADDFSPMANRLGWAKKFAPMAKAGEAIGTIRADLAAITGLPATTKIYAGLHDSNAALNAARGFAALEGRDTTVLSTGTWFIPMRLPLDGSPPPLSERRDCLINVDVFGRPVPSARFMGGREIESQIEIDTRRVDIKPDQPALLSAVPRILADGAMMFPNFAAGFGPYPGHHGRWINRPDDGPESWYARRAAVCLYAAMVTETCLSLVGANDAVLIEGRFAEAEVFTRALASLRPDLTFYTANAHNDVSFGALRLLHPELRPDGELTPVVPLAQDLSAYHRDWAAQLERATA